MIRTVCVDIDNTLLDFHAGAKECMTLALADYGVACTDAMFDTFTRINNALWQDLEKGLITRDELYAVRFARILAALNIPLDGPAVEARFRDNLVYSAVPMDGAHELMAYLHGKYTVCLMSNGAENQQRARMERARLLEYTDYLFTSEAMGAEKPSGAFFDACYAKMPDAAPESSVMIGDSLSADICGAMDYGIRTIWFNPEGKSAQGMQPDHTVRTLAEILAIL